jgi:hypothetical protein
MSIKGRDSNAEPIARKKRFRFPERRTLKRMQQKAINNDIKRRGPNGRFILKIREL